MFKSDRNNWVMSSERQSVIGRINTVIHTSWKHGIEDIALIILSSGDES